MGCTMTLRFVRRIIIAIVGGSVLVVGLAMLVLPGPAIVVVPAGLAILATEFVWAGRWLRRAKEMIVNAATKKGKTAITTPASDTTAPPTRVDLNKTAESGGRERERKRG